MGTSPIPTRGCPYVFACCWLTCFSHRNESWAVHRTAWTRWVMVLPGGMCVYNTVCVCIHVRMDSGPCSGYFMYMQTCWSVLDERAKLKNENNNLKRNITRLKRENAKHSGVSLPCGPITCCVMCVHHPPCPHRGDRSFTEGSELLESVGEFQ